jgi:signal transduction histidine kinase
MADAEAAELADAVRTSCDMLSGLASNALELRRLERGDLTVTRAPFCVRDTVRGVLQMCRMAKCSGAELAWEEAEELPPLVEGDTFLLDRIIMNLCTNALKARADARARVVRRVAERVQTRAMRADACNAMHQQR